MRERLEPKVRKKEILSAAVRAAKSNGYHKITRSDVALYAKVSPGLVNNYFNTMKQLRRAIMREAINKEVLEIIASGLVMQDAQARKAPRELKEKAMQLIIGV